MAKNTGNLIGKWAFLIGVVLALVFGLIGAMNETIAWILVIIGLIVGLLNIASEESEPFLLSGVALIIASFFGQAVVGISEIFNQILNALLLIFVPATIIVAIRNVFTLARH